MRKQSSAHPRRKRYQKKRNGPPINGLASQGHLDFEKKEWVGGENICNPQIPLS
eukprot:GAFH01005170.1.p4 GENE.GAFH01005170.1~~GAFH01005170.1.p4  ORF type:complete len:54 (-),score=1.54 GAFH01005170.1:424-585(-)